jgi:hypothetical protein
LTPATSPALRIVTFGNLDTGVWGAVCSAEQTAIALRSGDVEMTGPATLTAASEEWTVSAEGLELTVSPLGESVPNAAFDGFDQLARVTGTAGANEVTGICRRGSRGAIELGGSESVRDVSCWFEPDRGLALTAVRPRKSKGHDRDLVAAAVLDLEAEHTVADPRLSTTYSGEGQPARAGLELWLSEESEEDEQQQYPTRAAGERAGPGLVASLDGLEVLADPFRWHSRGADGTGVYLLLRPR